MPEIWFSLPMILIYSALFGVTIKIADLLDEHGLKWFKGSAIIFGIIWGVFGSLLVVSDSLVANTILAMVVAFIFRMRIDYRNHAIATVMIISTFLISSTFQLQTFFIFLGTFIAFGSIKDIFGGYYKNKSWINKLNETGWYVSIVPLVYSIITSNWIVFYALGPIPIFYNIVKYIGWKYGFNGVKRIKKKSA